MSASPSSPVRFAIVGAGAIASAYAEAFARTSRAQLVAVADVNPEAAARLAAPAGAAVFADAESLAQAADPVEAAIVCTPPSTHPEVCSALLRRGIHVLCEKPLSVSLDGAYQMIHAAAKGRALLTMASKFRYVDDVLAAKRLVEEGLLGDLILFENSFTGYVDMTNRWNSKPGISGGGVLIDNGTHSLDLARYFLGPIADLQVAEGKRSQNLPVEETVQIFLRSEAGVLGNIDLSWTISKQLPTYITLHGSKGTLSLGWKESKYRLHGGDWVVFGSGYSKVGAFLNQINNVAGAIRGTEELRITIEDGIASVRAVEAAYAALARGPWTTVKPEPDVSVLRTPWLTPALATALS
jgi:predicted dehydrogenase